MDELHQDKVTQTNVAKERKMVRIVTKYVEEGRQVEKIEEHETIWIVFTSYLSCQLKQTAWCKSSCQLKVTYKGKV
jgi:hypothetical protein